MTNKEKADEIAFNHKMTYLELENDGSVYDVDSYDECLASAMEMAKWKEEQMIEKVCEWLKDNLPNWVDSYKEDIIIENFKKAMEE